MPITPPATRPEPPIPGVRPLSLLFVAYHFAPDNASGTHRALHFARSLVDAGHRVTVLTVPIESLASIDRSLLNIFPFDDRILRVPPGATPGSVYLALKDRLRFRRRSTTSAAGETPVDTGSGGSDAGGTRETPGILRRLRAELAAWDVFPDEHRGWYRNAVAAGLARYRREPFDAVFVSSPPWTALRVAHTIARRTGRPLITDYRDPWTAGSGRLTPFGSPILHRRATRIERRIVGDSALMLFNSPSVLDVTRSSYGGRRNGRPEFRLILNGSNAPRRAESQTFPTPRPLALRHFGSLYQGRSIAALCGALHALAERGQAETGEVMVEVIGAHAERDAIGLPGTRTREDLPFKLRETPALPFQQAIARMLEPAVLVVVQPAVFDRQIPTKLYDYLCTGNPILVLAGEKSATWTVAREFKRCWRADPADVEAIAATINSILGRWRSGGLRQECADIDTAGLTKDALGRKFVSALEEALGTPMTYVSNP